MTAAAWTNLGVVAADIVLMVFSARLLAVARRAARRPARQRRSRTIVAANGSAEKARP